MVSEFASCGYTSASVHYIVNGYASHSEYVADPYYRTMNDTDGKPAGEITQMVRDSQYAWHARCWSRAFCRVAASVCPVAARISPVAASASRLTTLLLMSLP